jgi:hypothetical protein
MSNQHLQSAVHGQAKLSILKMTSPHFFGDKYLSNRQMQYTDARNNAFYGTRRVVFLIWKHWLSFIWEFYMYPSPDKTWIKGTGLDFIFFTDAFLLWDFVSASATCSPRSSFLRPLYCLKNSSFPRKINKIIEIIWKFSHSQGRR